MEDSGVEVGGVRSEVGTSSPGGASEVLDTGMAVGVDIVVVDDTVLDVAVARSQNISKLSTHNVP